MRRSIFSQPGAHEVSTYFGAIETRTSRLSVDLYLPSGLDQAPIVVVAHGFSRTRKNMAGLGRLLASHGFVAAVPDLPGWTDYNRNALEIAALLKRLRTDGVLRVPKPMLQCAVIGYSLGGLAALLAATMDSDVCCWIGLDPVDVNGSGEKAAKQLRVPAVVLCAEPAPWNEWKPAHHTGALVTPTGPSGEERQSL